MAERGIIFKDDFVSTPGKSWFDMSFDYLFSMNFGELVPSTCMECMAGDIIHAKSDSFVRLAPLVAPTFGKVNMFSYHFYVRNRSIWKSWESFFAEADQRESWQQSIQGNFVPPEMPYIKPMVYLRHMTNSTWLHGGSMLNSHTYALAYDNTTGHAFISDACNLNLLVIRATGDIELYEGLNGNNLCLFDYDFKTNKNAETIFVAYIPNKYDSHNEKDIAGYQSVERKYYNPFSNGTLFDYLGVDLSGHYVHQGNYVQRMVVQARTALNDNNPSLLFGGLQDSRIFLNGELLFDLPDFLKNKFVTLVAYNHNDQCVTKELFTLSAYQLTGDQTHASDVASLDPGTYYVADGKISTLPLRAYHSIYIDYFRDENYISVNPIIDFSRDGNDIPYADNPDFDNVFDYLTLNYKAYEHDPYTTALPQAQRGAAVRFMNDAHLKFGDSVSTANTNLKSGAAYLYVNDKGISAVGSTSVPSSASAATSITEVIVDLSAATIENFRFANATQKLLEKIARSGNRYFEYMKAIYGVVIDDAKIDRPIYLGGDKSPIQISEVLQTSASEVTTDQPLGQMAGRGVSVGNDDFIEYITPDNGFFIEICCALPRTNYQQGLAPYFHRFDRLDFAIPDYAQLGEQQVPQRELWYAANDEDDETPFGYQSRYYDYKYLRDRTSGSFKDSLSFWTWSRIFDQAPIAGKEFIEVRPDYRQFAVTDKNVEHIYVHMWHDIQVNRCLPVFGTPSL